MFGRQHVKSCGTCSRSGLQVYPLKNAGRGAAKRIKPLKDETKMEMDYANARPSEIRKKIRNGEITTQTSGMCMGYAQANLVILPYREAYDFLLFAQRNPTSCPLLEVCDKGSRSLRYIAEDADIARDIPKYRIYEYGKLVREVMDVSDIWRSDFVSFLIGCSFSFEAALLEAEVPVRQIEEHCNVPMYLTNLPCVPAGVFHGNMVVSMRPMTPGSGDPSDKGDLGNAAGTRSSDTFRQSGGDWYPEYFLSRLRRSCDHPRGRNPSVLALRRDASGGCDGGKTAAGDYTCAGTYADHGFEKYGAEILRLSAAAAESRVGRAQTDAKASAAL